MKIKINPENRFLLIILSICFVIRIIYFGFWFPYSYFYNSDSITYLVSIDIFHGVFDLYRTPVYIYIIQFFRFLSSDHWFHNLLLFQHVISFLSLIPFFYILKSLTKNKYIIFTVLIFYNYYPLFLNQTINLNPESLCLCGSIFMLFFLTKYSNKPGKTTAFCIGFFPFFLIMLKPIYLPLLIPGFLFIAGRYLLVRPERKKLLWGFAGLLLSIGCLAGYCETNRRNYGEFALSKISLNNTLANIIISNAYPFGQDDELIRVINDNSDPSSNFYEIVFTFNYEYIDKYKESYRKFPANLRPTKDMNLLLQIQNSYSYSRERLNAFSRHAQLSKPYIYYIILQIIRIFTRFDILTLIICFELFRLLLTYRKFKRFLWIQSFCILFILIQFFTIAIGGIDDWNRLFLPAIPFSFTTFVIFADSIFLQMHDYFHKTD